MFAAIELSVNYCYMLADLVVALHVAYIAYVVVGQALIVAGLIGRWQWIRNFWFRASHLLMISIVAVESIFAFECPLTTWENELKIMALRPAQRASTVSLLASPLGQGPLLAAAANYPGSELLAADNGSFIGRWLHQLIFYDMEYDDWKFTVAYITFAALVLATFVLAPPRRPNRGPWRATAYHDTGVNCHHPAIEQRQVRQ
jgi:hypothetical protein